MKRSSSLELVRASPSQGGKSTLRLDTMNPNVEEDRAKNVRWLTRTMAEDFSRRDVLYTTVKEALFYALFITAVTISTVGRRQAAFFYLTQALKGQFIEREFNTANDLGIQFNDITSITDFWHYAETLLLDSFYWDHYYDADDPVTHVKEDDRKILFENQLLGVPRIRQVKVKKNSCTAHEFFKKLILSCYSIYKTSVEDKAPFGPGKGTAWVYNTPEQTQSVEFSGGISTYGAGGFYVDLLPTREKTAELIGELKKKLWVNRATRVVFIDFTIYNANVNLFCICKLVVEFPPTGGAIPSHSFETVHLLKYVKSEDYITFGFEILVYIMTIYFICEEVREAMYFKWKYFLQFWTYMDIMIITMALANVIFALIMDLNVDMALIKIKENPDEYGNLEYLGDIKVLYNEFTAGLLFFSYIKIFKYLNFNKTMGQLNNTLKRCALDILGFGLMFAIIFFAFAELGYLLFGNEVSDFRTFGIAGFTLLRTILGDFEYHEIEEANAVLAPIYFIAFIFLVFFVLLNMFLAIINDTYSEVKTEIAIAPEELQMTDFLIKGLYNILQKCGWKVKEYDGRADFNATVQQIRDALAKCDFTDLEIEMFFARYNIDPMAEIFDYDENQILRELEINRVKRKQVEAEIVQVHDFIRQQERLDQIEKTTILLGNKIDDLLDKLRTIEHIRTTRDLNG